MSTITIALPEDQLQATLAAAIKSGVIEAVIGADASRWRSATGGAAASIGHQLEPEIKRIAGRLLADDAFCAELNATIKAAILSGAHAGAEEEGRKIGARAARKGAA